MPLDVLEQNLREMISRARSAGAAVLLLAMRIPPNYGPYYANAFADIYTKLGASESVYLTPFLLDGVAAVPGMMQDDGVHPTMEAQPRMLDNVWPTLQPLPMTVPAPITVPGKAPQEPAVGAATIRPMELFISIMAVIYMMIVFNNCP